MRLMVGLNGARNQLLTSLVVKNLVLSGVGTITIKELPPVVALPPVCHLYSSQEGTNLCNEDTCYILNSQ